MSAKHLQDGGQHLTRPIGTVIRSVHLVIGWSGVVIFFATGVLMRSRFPDAYADADALRYIYRANHVYVLAASLVNLVLGMYMQLSDRVWEAWASRIGSILVMGSAVLLVLAFFVEASTVTPDRVLTLLGVIALGAGVLGHVLGHHGGESTG